MAIKASDYIAKLPDSCQLAIKAEAQKRIAEELTLADLREARRRSQSELAPAPSGPVPASPARSDRQPELSPADPAGRRGTAAGR